MSDKTKSEEIAYELTDAGVILRNGKHVASMTDEGNGYKVMQPVYGRYNDEIEEFLTSVAEPLPAEVDEHPVDAPEDVKQVDLHERIEQLETENAQLRETLEGFYAKGAEVKAEKPAHNANEEPQQDRLLGDRTPEYVLWFHKNHTREEFATRYRGRIPSNEFRALFEQK